MPIDCFFFLHINRPCIQIGFSDKSTTIVNLIFRNRSTMIKIWEDGDPKNFDEDKKKAYPNKSAISFVPSSFVVTTL